MSMFALRVINIMKLLPAFELGLLACVCANLKGAIPQK